MSILDTLLQLNQILLEEMPEYQSQASSFPKNVAEQGRLYRSLVNLRPPYETSEQYRQLEAEYLQYQRLQKGVVKLEDAPQIQLWKGDITTLQVDAIVNAANNALLGCFIPCHGCIDNVIHSSAGVQLRLDCHQLMTTQGHREATGQAKITKGYNLPCRYVIHTVGPIIQGRLTQQDCDLLASCYEESLKLAVVNKLKSIAFCCISTGEFHFPNEKAAEIAVATVTKFLKDTQSEIEVIFNVFKEKDYAIYRNLLGENCENPESH